MLYPINRFSLSALFSYKHPRLCRSLLTSTSCVPSDAVQFLQSQPRDSRSQGQRDGQREFFMTAWRLLNVPVERGQPEAVNRLIRVLMDDQYFHQPNRALLAMLVKAHLAK